MRYYNIYDCTCADGVGVRVSVYFSGCCSNKLNNDHCKGCHNKELQSFYAGKLFTEDVKNKILNFVDKDYIDGLTLCGGEPLDQDISELYDLVVNTKKKTKNIWCYTGYTWDKILEMIDSNPLMYLLLLKIDALVINPFILSLRDITSENPWRGSTNQKIINPKESLLQGKLIYVPGIKNNAPEDAQAELMHN